MSDDTHRSRTAPAERFAGNEHVFDLTAEAQQLRTAAGESRGHQQKTLFKHPTGTMSLMLFDAGRGLAEHQAKGYVTIQVLRGVLAVKTAESYHQLHSGQVLVMAPNLRHSVTAVDGPVEMLLIVNLV